MTMTWEAMKAKCDKKLIGLQPVVLAATLCLLKAAYSRGIPLIITQGLRTIEEQNALYAQGRTKPGAIVTNARGGYSYHNFGLAVDFALLTGDGSEVSWDMNRDGNRNGSKDWNEVVEIAKRLGFEWGGDFVSIKDAPHLQMSFGLSTAELRAGKQPTAAQTKVVYDAINKYQEGDDEMSEADKKRLETLEAAVAALANSRDVLKDQVLQQAGQSKDLTGRVAGLEAKASLAEIPAWARSAVDAAMASGLINTPTGGSQDFYRLLTIMGRAGLLAAHKEG